MPGIAVYLDLDIVLYLKADTSDATKAKVMRNIKKSIAMYFNQNPAMGSCSISRIRSLILGADKEITGVLSREGKTNLLKSVYLRKSYGEGNITSERTTLSIPTITLNPEEFFTLGLLSITFEVEK